MNNSKMFSQELLTAFKSKIENAKNIAIFSHENVDGDAVGSLLSLGKVCENLGKNVGLFTTLTPAKSFNFIPVISKIRTDFDYSDTRDLIIFVDFHEYKRIGKITEGHEAYFDAKEKLIVDHHIGDTVYENCTLLKEPEASSTCELLYEICSALFPEQLDADTATYMYLGLVTDTGNFTFEVDTVRTMTSAIGLIKLGARKPWLMQYIFNNASRESVDLLKMITPRITRTGNVCYVWYTNEEIERLGFDKEETDILILNNIRPIKDIGVIAIIRDSGTGQIGVSMRSGYLASGERINVQKIALVNNGGGHIYAAGCKILLTKDFQEQVSDIVTMINSEIDKQIAAS